jgi:hypothetical protein
MFLNNEPINKKLLKIKKPLNYNLFDFFPIKYDNKELIIETTKLFVPFGIQSYNNKKYIFLSFQNILNDDKTKILFNNLSIIQEKVMKDMKIFFVDVFLKNDNLLKLKIDDKVLFYNQNKNLINDIDKFSYGKFIIYLSGLWCKDNKIWFDWRLLQAKVDVPIYLMEYSFSDKNDDIINHKGKGKGKGKGPPPPPPPPPSSNDIFTGKYKTMFNMGIPREAILNKMKLDSQPLNLGELKSVKLKKTEKDIKCINLENQNVPSLEQITNALLKLKKVN